MKQKHQKNDVIVSRDIYEIAYFLTKTACRIERIEVVEELGKPASIVTLSGKDLKKLQLDYLNGVGSVDAISYRKSLSYVRTLVFGEISKSKREAYK